MALDSNPAAFELGGIASGVANHASLVELLREKPDKACRSLGIQHTAYSVEVRRFVYDFCFS